MKSAMVVYLLVIIFAFVECLINLPVNVDEAKICAKWVKREPPTFVDLHSYEELQVNQIIELPYNAFQNLSNQPNVTSIVLNDCQINRVHSDAFLNLSHLERLDLTQNKLHDLDSKLFQHVQQIKKISINNNMIKTLHAGLFENLVLLEAVELHSNQIEVIEPGAFHKVPSLRYIDLGNNKLQYLDPSVVQSFSNVSHFYLHDNPWTCDCNLTELQELFGKVPLTSNGQMPECENPLELRGKKWKDLSNDECNLQIIMPTNNIKEVVQADTNITLTCMVHSRSKPEMNWYKDSGIIEAQYLSSSSSKQIYYLSYTFTVDEYNAGVYYCNTSESRQVSNITIGVYRKTEKPIATATASSWIRWLLVFVEICSVVGMIVGLVFVVRWILPKYRTWRHALLAKNIAWSRCSSNDENPMHMLIETQVSE